MAQGPSTSDASGAAAIDPLLPDAPGPDSESALPSYADVSVKIPGLVFQLRRDARGRLQLTELVGSDPIAAVLSPLRDVLDIRQRLGDLMGEAYTEVMRSVEHSAHWLSPITTRLRLACPESAPRWYSIQAIPERLDDGIVWHGVMVDIEEQVAEEQRLRYLSGTDELTGLANRRAFMGQLERAVSLSTRHATALSVMLLDLDHFALINDTWGEGLGDRVLCQLAALVASQLRQEDLLARMGSDEFALLVPLTPAGRSRELGERLCQSAARHDFGIGRQKVTVSIGISDFVRGGNSAQLMQSVHANLMDAKRLGRNRVVHRWAPWKE
ncbi:GGDEF domain-containing protein [Halomonas sp. V046]|uniref:GGDEF domain-containing protein n=1 Tax=Halomonas sp. V046 TaxID=3459611 RepID=UPI0040445922